jgi:hypothetical protein
VTRDDTGLAADRHPILGFILTLALVFACDLAGGSRDPLPAQPNLLVFVVDAARVDHFGVYGYERNTTPNIDAFAQDATRFTNAISEGSFTFASISSLFVGLPPDRTGLLRARQLGKGLTLLPEVAQDAGYRTRGYSENPYITPGLGFARGFDAFETTLAYKDFKRDTLNLQHSDASAQIDAMLAFMGGESGLGEELDIGEESDQPFLAYVHLLRPHNPYAPSADFAGRFGSSGAHEQGNTRRLLRIDRKRRPISAAHLENLRALYDENLAVADAMFGRLVDGMHERGLLDETIVVLLSDHGEGFLEHGRLLHGSTTFDEMIRIPLLIRIPGMPPGVVDHPIQLAPLGDMLQGIVSGSRAPRSLLAARDEDPEETISWSMPHEHQACVRSRTRKLIVDPASLEVVGYYDITTDPFEANSLQLDAEGSRLLTLLDNRISDGHAFLRKPPASNLDPQLLEQVRALGYIEE